MSRATAIKDVRVRIGLAIRQKEIRLRLFGDFLFLAGDGSSWQTTSAGFTLRCSHPSDEPRWGQRLQTFSTPEPAHLLLKELAAHGVESRIVQLGRPASWGEAGELTTSSWAVVTGDESTVEEAVEKARTLFDQLPVKHPEERLAGWKRYEHQLLAPDPIRLTLPQGGTIQMVDDRGVARTVPSPLTCKPLTDESRFELGAVRIGIDFHWDHVEQLQFRGELDLVADGDALTAVNELELDSYLTSVLGSEMRPDWPVEALAAQAVAARSTVLATRGRHHYGEAFDLCHDDHCQCYQGVSRESETARKALERVDGLLLTQGNRVADARYAKSCGGLADHYHVAWDDEDISFMQPVLCGPLTEGKVERNDVLRMGGERLLDSFLETLPDWAACNPEAVPYPPSCVEMEELYWWNREIEQDRLQALVEGRTGRKLGKILKLIPLERGVSGRIRFLRVVAEKGEVVVGKELAIRRLLSDSHLPSSAFRATFAKDGGVLLEGIGWGHGVGMCQLGAAALAARGWSAERLLTHYYPGAKLVSKHSSVEKTSGIES